MAGNYFHHQRGIGNRGGERPNLVETATECH